VELTVLKDVIFILAIGAVAFVLSMGLKILVFLGQLSFVAAFLWFCYWYTRKDVFERSLVRDRVLKSLGMLGMIRRR
jgi:hypothetical protein